MNASDCNGLFLKSVPHKECTKKLCWPVSSAAPVPSAAPKKNHLIEAASIKCGERPFRGGLGGLCPPSQNRKFFEKFSKNFEKKKIENKIKSDIYRKALLGGLAVGIAFNFFVSQLFSIKTNGTKSKRTKRNERLKEPARVAQTAPV